jgi:hypothetical protein
VVVFNVPEICSVCKTGDELLVSTSNIGEYCTIGWTVL